METAIGTGMQRIFTNIYVSYSGTEITFELLSVELLNYLHFFPTNVWAIFKIENGERGVGEREEREERRNNGTGEQGDGSD